MNLFRISTLAACIASSFAFGCGSQGAGTGTVTQPVTTRSAAVAKRYEGQVRFDWKSDGANAKIGTIRAAMPDGRVFAGEYAETTKANEGHIPAFYSFNCKWPSCFDDDSREEGKPREYTGRVVARLTSENGAGSEPTRMICSFDISKKNDGKGPKDGGLGSCLLSDGKRIESAALVER